ncbi:MAG: response regulator [Bacillales bacterium]|nr:response regulator [Bacillales bacterium]
MKKEIKLNEVEELDETNPNIIDLSEKTILVVDDIDINRSILIETLKLGNAKVIDVENGQIAVDTFAKDYQTIDLILMDIRMPVMDGYEATRIIRTLNEKGKVIPIIAVSAHLYQKDIYKAFDAGMTDHLPKPIDVSKLYEIIARNIK